MSDITYLHNWNPDLCIQLKSDKNYRADFNRFLVKHFPSTAVIQQGQEFEDADREGFVLQLKSRFDEAIEENASHETLYSLYFRLSQYLRWCDKESVLSFTQSSIEDYMNHQNLRVMRGEIKSISYTRIYYQIMTVFTQYLDLPRSYFNKVTVRDYSDKESYEAYTRSDLKQILPFLRALFKQTHQQFINDPERHIKAHRNTSTMTFHWKGREYKLRVAISKMMAAATFLMAYYTYANTSELFKLKQPENASTTLGEVWYTMPAFKRRAFKTIRVEMGAHELEIPKYSMDFFDKLLEASRLIFDGENALLLQTIPSNKVHPITNNTLQNFLGGWVEKHFTFTDQTGRRLRPVVSRFRESGAQLTTFHQGEMANNIMLDNTLEVRKKHYSEGNKQSNKGMIQDTMAIREEQARSGVKTEEARKNSGIDVLVIEKENAINLPNLSRTSNGGSCDDPFGSKSQKYSKKAHKQGLSKEGERLACADLLGCFGCPHQVIVQSVADIWCLLSFRACIEESLYLHLDAHHYRKNFEQVIVFIDSEILPKIHSKIVKQAQDKLNYGLHPAWDEPESILYLIPERQQENV
ncbi:hypothetical protein [Photobacterium angustum]|uniref:Core-binding (CB) domain-containing protein n=1 Tax=Photobacterium angustum TaxID=661 RepID=A0A855SEW2_PHOAN|nr:hypothetical protein [Photobacterium angustum]KJF79834.1 hypothetical protein UB36_20610 [Photobacterium damselae subsp. damselae]KJG42474.1 hypothetical protein UA35_00185 [Photobacterium angustum]KJG43325.1 hypothetical protein UA31_20615 [Photobacterium angustum]KJG49771.1 hypothetical protein UA30_04315 [Photobacterium angustum]KJG54125.1 hypothetical protein UA34_07825 [Photobacterium angustum]